MEGRSDRWKEGVRRKAWAGWVERGMYLRWCPPHPQHQLQPPALSLSVRLGSSPPLIPPSGKELYHWKLALTSSFCFVSKENSILSSVCGRPIENAKQFHCGTVIYLCVFLIIFQATDLWEFGVVRRYRCKSCLKGKVFTVQRCWGLKKGKDFMSFSQAKVKARIRLILASWPYSLA